MRWGFQVEGQPVSWNAAYGIGVVNRRAYNRRPREVRTIVKTDKAVAYTGLAMRRCQEKRPRGWSPTGLVVVEFYYFLGRDIDCDNVMKLVNDGIEAATGVDDKWFLPRAIFKTTGLRPSQRKIVVILDDQPDLSAYASLVPPP
ncbi:MAG TPA: hypothetical protein VFX15_03005 [Actinomycetes bacterium]|nr:hypothetical protein [Actinomycetes bacterium]